jgi:lipid-A-disaccharide synthase-like uncharacterized protein
MNDTRTNIMKKIAIHLQTERYLIEEINKAVEEEAKATINSNLFYYLKILGCILFLVMVIYIYFQQRQGHRNIIHLNTTGENGISV